MYLFCLIVKVHNIIVKVYNVIGENGYFHTAKIRFFNELGFRIVFFVEHRWNGFDRFPVAEIFLLHNKPSPQPLLS